MLGCAWTNTILCSESGDVREETEQGQIIFNLQSTKVNQPSIIDNPLIHKVQRSTCDLQSTILLPPLSLRPLIVAEGSGPRRTSQLQGSGLKSPPLD